MSYLLGKLIFRSTRSLLSTLNQGVCQKLGELLSKNHEPDKEQPIEAKGNFTVSRMRKEQNAILRSKVASLSDIKSVLNIGSMPYSQDKEGSRYEDYFPRANYFTLDNRACDAAANHFNLDAHDLALLKQKFDLVICMSFLEHVRNPFQVAREIGSLLESKGYLYICTPFFFPIHKALQKGFSDYWRFTDDGLRELFSGFSEIWMIPVGSVIETVSDRKKHWSKAGTPSGYCALFQKKDCA